MRRILAGLLLTLAPLLALAAEHGAPVATHAPDGVLEVASGIDRLGLFQDAAAAGRMDALQEQKKLLHDVGKSLSIIRATRNPRLADLMVAYVLSGGDPLIVGRASKDMDMDPADRRLLDGATLFMEGDLHKASDLLSKLDPLRLPARIGGRVALAQAQLAELPARQERYALAISAMPGTLLEESALRRSALSSADARDEALFWKRLERYQRRFPNSIFAASFWRQVMDLIGLWAAKGPAPDLHRLDVILAMKPVADRRQLYLGLARRAAALGNPELTDFAAHRLQRLAVDRSTESRLGVLYASLYRIVSQDGDTALASLRSLRPDMFSSTDKALLLAALSIGQQIDRPAPANSQSDSGEAAGRSPVEEQGASLLSRSSTVLAELH